MKLKLLILYFTFPLIAIAQDPVALLKKSYKKCQAVQYGYYEMTQSMKYMTRQDTQQTHFRCHFKKLKDDSLFSSAFHYQYNRPIYDSLWRDVLYTGDDFVKTNPKDSTAEIMRKSQWADDIKSIAHNYTFYTPLTDGKSSPIPHIDSEYTNKKKSYEYLGETWIDNRECYHIRVVSKRDEDQEELMRVIMVETHYWIHKKDFIPVRYSVAVDLVMNNDTMRQFESCSLKNYKLNPSKDKELISLKSIPAYYKFKDYVPYKRPESLPDDTLAPLWELNSILGEKIRLEDLRGKVVLVDFFYKSCYPCMLALPGLQAIHEKYKDSSVVVIGIDPYDTKEEMVSFLAKRGVNYKILLDGKDAAKDYRVYAYPTLFIIDQHGRIRFTQIGYGEGTEEKLEQKIQEYIK